MNATYKKFSSAFLESSESSKQLKIKLKTNDEIKLSGKEEVVYLTPHSLGMGYIGNSNGLSHAGKYNVITKAPGINVLLDYNSNDVNFRHNFILLLSQANGDVALIYNEKEDMFLVVALADVVQVQAP